MKKGLARLAIGLAVLLLTTPAVGAEDFPLGVTTPEGIPLAVSWQTTSGYWVTTPCGAAAHISDVTPIGATTVVLDPGHGGPIDTGAVAFTGMPEKELNLRVAFEAQAALAEKNIDAVLTRTGDYATPLSIRANFADTLQAKLMVSIHHNAPTPGLSSLPGIEVFYQKSSKASGRLGGLLWENAREALSQFDVRWVASEDAGAMTVLNTRGDDAYGIIRHPDTPTALIELGYISNPAEAALHQTPEYAPVAGEAIAQAIEEYLETDKPGSGFVRGRVFNPQPGVGFDVCIDPPITVVLPSIWPVLPPLSPLPE
jgi:N-acetylmuramoyl-L-alanine amidase